MTLHIERHFNHNVSVARATTIRVLLAERDPVFQVAMQRGLEARGHLVLAVSDGPSLMDAVSEEEVLEMFDVIVIGSDFPGITSAEVGELVRMHYNMGTMPIVALEESSGGHRNGYGNIVRVAAKHRDVEHVCNIVAQAALAQLHWQLPVRPTLHEVLTTIEIRADSMAELERAYLSRYRKGGVVVWNCGVLRVGQKVAVDIALEGRDPFLQTLGVVRWEQFAGADHARTRYGIEFTGPGRPMGPLANGLMYADGAELAPRARRLYGAVPMDCVWRGTGFSTAATNISRTGALLATDELLPVGAKASLRLAETGGDFSIHAEVVRQQKGDNAVGVRFLSSSPAGLRQMQRLADTLERRHVRYGVA